MIGFKHRSYFVGIVFVYDGDDPNVGHLFLKKEFKERWKTDINLDDVETFELQPLPSKGEK